jgi:DeoR family transcriptional regulator of aga operon
MVGSATRAIAVADGGKLGRVHLGRIAAVDEFAGLITGETAGESAVAALRATGLAVTVV